MCDERLRQALAATTLAAMHALAEPEPPAAIRIRRAVDADLDALVELEQRVFSGDRLSRRQLRAHLDSLSAHVLVATRERRLIGVAVIFFRRGSDLARLYSIAVVPEARGLGLGDALLAAAERTARRRGARRMRLEVRRDNVGAQRLYERKGYRHFARSPGYYEDGHEAWRYERDLETRDQGSGAGVRLRKFRRA